MRSDHACAYGCAYHGTYATAYGGAKDSSAAGARTEFNEGPLAMFVGDDVAFTLDLGIGAESINDLGMQMVASAVR